MIFETLSAPMPGIYRQMFDRAYFNSSYHMRKNYAVPQVTPKEEESGIEQIINQDSEQVLDKLKTSALSIAYRIKINKDINATLFDGWKDLRSEILYSEDFMPQDRQSRLRSTLSSQLGTVYQQLIDEKRQCWKDIKDEMKEFIEFFHNYQNAKQEKSLMQNEQYNSN